MTGINPISISSINNNPQNPLYNTKVQGQITNSNNNSILLNQLNQSAFYNQSLVQQKSPEQETKNAEEMLPDAKENLKQEEAKLAKIEAEWAQQIQNGRQFTEAEKADFESYRKSVNKLRSAISELEQIVSSETINKNVQTATA